jgi:hypothetical protein
MTPHQRAYALGVFRSNDYQVVEPDSPRSWDFRIRQRGYVPKDKAKPWILCRLIWATPDEATITVDEAHALLDESAKQKALKVNGTTKGPAALVLLHDDRVVRMAWLHSTLLDSLPSPDNVYRIPANRFHPLARLV